MEPANIDWKNIESIFVEDDLYENINAPKFIDFSSSHDNKSGEDEAWFCKPECRHPKIAEDFLKPSFASSKVKHSRSFSVFDNFRDGKGTSRRLNRAKTFIDQENENPNLYTPPEKTKLKSSLSASNLFAGKEILNQITEFCSELKKMVLKTKEGENVKKGKESNDQKEKLLEECSEETKKTECENVKPLVQVELEKKPRKLKRNEKENNPIAGNLNNLAGKEQEERLLQVRTNPPSPQCFSGYREPIRRTKHTTPLKPSPSKSIRAGKGVLQEQNGAEKEEATPEKVSNKHIVAGKEARSMEMLWILKPCLAK